MSAIEIGLNAAGVVAASIVFFFVGETWARTKKDKKKKLERSSFVAIYPDFRQMAFNSLKKSIEHFRKQGIPEWKLEPYAAAAMGKDVTADQLTRQEGIMRAMLRNRITLIRKCKRKRGVKP